MNPGLLQWVLWTAGFALQAAVLRAMLRGPWRRLPVVLLFIVVLMLTTVTDVAAKLTVSSTKAFVAYYWCAELLRQSALFAVTVSLILQLVAQARSRRSLATIIVGSAVVFWSASVLLSHQPVLNIWMTRVVRNLSFGSAALNVLLWFSLISRQSRDLQLLLVAGGLGIQMTGDAIGQSFRALFPRQNPEFVGSLFVVIAHFLCLLIWWYAFSRGEGNNTGDVHLAQIDSG